MEKLSETLNKNTKASALALRDLLGSIELEPLPGECVVENGRLIENRLVLCGPNADRHPALLDVAKVTNRLKWRTRHSPIRTISLIPCQIKIPFIHTMPVYQKLAPKIKQLKSPGYVK